MGKIDRYGGMEVHMDKIEERKTLSQEFKAALYSALKQKGYKVTSGYREPSHDEDAFEKIDVFYKLDGEWVPTQIRVYSQDWNLPGFPTRDTSLKTGSEMEKLKAGELDNYLFAYATAARIAESEWGKYKFLTIKVTKGRDLRENADKIIGERTFKEGTIKRHDFYEETTNHVSFIADPASTVYLRNWK